MSNSNDRNDSTGFGSGSLGVTGDNYDQNNTRSGVNTDYRHPLAGGAGDVHPNLPPLGRALGATTYDENSSHGQSGLGGVGSGGQRNIPAELERSTGHHSDAHRAAGEGATYGGVGGIMGAGLEREGDDSSRRNHDQQSHQSHISSRNIPSELERSTGHHSAQHRAVGEGATYGGVGGIMGAGLGREGDDSSRRAHDQHSSTSTGRNIPSELERTTGHHSSEHRTTGAGATSGGVGGIMGAGLEREGHDSSAHRSQDYSTEHSRHSDELSSGTGHSSRQSNVLAAGAGAGAGGIAAAGLAGRDSQSSRSTYDSSNTSSNTRGNESATGREGQGRVPQSATDVKSVDDARAGMENLKMKHTDSEGFTDLTGGRPEKTEGNLFTGRLKNLDGSDKTPVVETGAERSEKDAQGRELDSYGKPYTL